MKRKTKQPKVTTSNYPVGDFLVRIKNASLARRKTVEFPLNKFVSAVAKSLVKERYLQEVQIVQGFLKANLSFRRKEPVITDIKIVSKPGLRVYMKVEDLQKKRGPSIYILSTPEGVMSSKEAIKKGLGGEVIAEII
jgi:small subunit ribosomal protein S8